jgi:hypothetical protein
LRGDTAQVPNPRMDRISKLGMERRTQAAAYAARVFADESDPEKEGPDR